VSETSWLVRPCWYHAQGCHEACAAVDAEVATLRRQLSEARRALEERAHRCCEAVCAKAGRVGFHFDECEEAHAVLDRTKGGL